MDSLALAALTLVQAEAKAPGRVSVPVAHFVSRIAVRGLLTGRREDGARARWEKLSESAGEHLLASRRLVEVAGLPREFALLPVVESAFNPSALSRMGALGLWQLMPKTARSLGLTVDRFVDERLDPLASGRAALTFLDRLYFRYGDWKLALAAYNCGTLPVDRALAKSCKRKPRRRLKRHKLLKWWAEQEGCWDYDGAAKYLPRETRSYVKLFSDLSRSLDGLGAADDPPLAAPPDLDTVRFDGSVDIALVAEALALDYDDLRRLNPTLAIGVTPPSGWDVVVPAGAAGEEECVRELVNAYEEREIPLRARHRVRKRETLGKIARAYGVPLKKLLKANGFSRAKRLKRGAVIEVPLAVSARSSRESITDLRTGL